MDTSSFWRGPQSVNLKIHPATEVLRKYGYNVSRSGEELVSDIVARADSGADVTTIVKSTLAHFMHYPNLGPCKVFGVGGAPLDGMSSLATITVVPVYGGDRSPISRIITVCISDGHSESLIRTHFMQSDVCIHPLHGFYRCPPSYGVPTADS